MSDPSRSRADLGELFRLIGELAAGNIAARGVPSGSDDEVDRAIASLNQLGTELTALHTLKDKATARLAELTEMALSVAALDYSKKAKIGDDPEGFDGLAAGLNLMMEELDGLAAGMNMMIEELQSSTMFVNNVLGAMTDALFVVDAEGLIRSANRAALGVLGYSKRELLNQPVTRIFPSDVAELVLRHLRDGSALSDDESILVARGGKGIPISVSASTLRGAQGEVQGLVIVARDNTERRRAEEERDHLLTAVQRQADAIMAMSTPLIPISDDIVVMPLIGALDSRRASQIVETLLRGVTAVRARVAILDITGVAVVDHLVAETVLGAVRTTTLVGSKVVLTGIRPDVAKAITELDVDLGDVVTCGTLKEGIAYARASLKGPATRRRRRR